MEAACWKLLAKLDMVFDMELKALDMLAMVCCGEFESVDACAEALLSVTETIEPDPEIAARYEEQYQKFSRIYPALKGVFPQLR